MSHSYIIGIDLGGTNIKIGILDKAFKIKAKTILSTKEFSGKNSLIAAISGGILLLLSKCKIKKQYILGIGIGLPGPIDYQKGMVHYFPNIAGWRNVPLAKIIARQTGFPVFIDNDVNLIALAESRFGAGRLAKNMVCLTLGTGVGGGIIVEGGLYRGSSFSAGEIGHIPISFSGPKCGCGARGCLESYIGNSHILAKAKRVFGKITLEQLSCKAKSGDIKAVKIWRQIGGYLGFALTGVVNFFNPDCIVIGGGVSGAGNVLFDQVRKTIFQRAMSPAKNKVRVVKTQLGNDAGIIGAALLVLEHDKK